MPLVLIAGTVAAQPKANAFPASGRPRCEIRVKVEGDTSVTLFRIVGYDDQMAELEILLPGDSVAIQGRLEVGTQDGRLAGLYVVALQVMALRTRSMNPALRARA
jgi:hypothetical protein